MIRKDELLNQVRVEKPCPAHWESMEGDATMRYCGQCRHHVHNLSEMTAAEAEALLANRTGRLCVRFEKDAAGVLITRDRRPRRWNLWGRLALAGAALLSAFGFQQPGAKPPAEMGDVALPKPPEKVRKIIGRIALPKITQGKPVVSVPTVGIVAEPYHPPKPAKPPVKPAKKPKKVVKAKPVVKPKPNPPAKPKP